MSGPDEPRLVIAVDPARSIGERIEETTRLLFLGGPGDVITVALDALARAHSLIPHPLDIGPMLRRPFEYLPGQSVKPGRPRTYRPHRYKGSAMAKRATLRGGNPARSGLARLAP